MNETNTFEEFRIGGWQIVLGSVVGVALGSSALPFYTLGVFVRPLAQAFGWSRAVVQSGLLFAMLGTVCVAGIAGSMIDRFGVRRVAIVSQAGLAAGFVLLACQDGNPTLWRASWFLLAVFGIGTTPLTWSRGIAGWFVTARGTALGMALAGTGITAFIAPPLIGRMIAAFGWRAAYAAIAAAIVFIGMPCVLLFFHGARRGAASIETGAPGVSFAAALRGYRFWLILLCFAAVSFGVGGVIPNLVSMLTDRGIRNATAYASLLGVAIIVGRLAAGWLLDRWWAPAVAAALLAVPAVACALLAFKALPAMDAVLIGLAGGAEFDLVAYLCARYFGMQSYARLYAWQWASLSLCAGIGSLTFGVVFDRTGNYDAALFGAAVLMLAGGLCLLGLGRYPRQPAAAS